MLLRILFFHLGGWNFYSLNTPIYLYSIYDKLKFEMNQALCGNSYAGSGPWGHPRACLGCPCLGPGPHVSPGGCQPLPQPRCSRASLQLPMLGHGLCQAGPPFQLGLRSSLSPGRCPVPRARSARLLTAMLPHGAASSLFLWEQSALAVSWHAVPKMNC